MMAGSTTNTPFTRTHAVQVVLTVLGLSGVGLIFVPSVNYPVMSPMAVFLEPYPFDVKRFMLVTPCVVLPIAIAAGYIRWLVTGRLSRWEGGLGYVLALMAVGLGVANFSVESIYFLLAFGAGAWFVIQNLQAGVPPAFNALVAMQTAYLPFALYWLSLPITYALFLFDVSMDAFLAFVTVTVYTVHAALSGRAHLRELGLLPLGLLWGIGVWWWLLRYIIPTLGFPVIGPFVDR